MVKQKARPSTEIKVDNLWYLCMKYVFEGAGDVLTTVNTTVVKEICKLQLQCKTVHLPPKANKDLFFVSGKVIYGLVLMVEIPKICF